MRDLFINNGKIIANELITLNDKIGVKQISFEDHQAYIDELVEYAYKNLNISINVVPCKDGFEQWSKQNHDYFEVFKQDNKWYIRIKDGIKNFDLRRYFRAPLNYEILKTIKGTEQKLIEIVTKKEQNNNANFDDETIREI